MKENFLTHTATHQHISTSKNQHIKDYLRLHFIVLLWGFTAILGKLLTVPPVELVFWRTALAATGLAALLRLRGQTWRVPAGQAVRLLGVGALVAAHWITFFLAARLSSVSVCLAGLATLALWTSLLEPLLLWRRVRGYEVGLGLLTLLGLYLVSQAELDQLLGLGVAVLSAGLSALFSVLNSKLIKTHPPLRLTFYEMLGACLSIVAFFPVYSRYFTAGKGLAAGLARIRLALAGAAGRGLHRVRLFHFGGIDEAAGPVCGQSDHQSGAGVRDCTGGADFWGQGTDGGWVLCRHAADCV